MQLPGMDCRLISDPSETKPEPAHQIGAEDGSAIIKANIGQSGVYFENLPGN